MPIHAGKSEASLTAENDDETAALLKHDEESQLLPRSSSPTRYADEAADTRDGVNGGHASRQNYGTLTTKQKILRAARTASRNKHRSEISQALKQFDMQAYHQYRVSDEDIKKIDNKKVKKFVKEQNDKLHQWFEVDAVVHAMAEDVLSSFEPQGASSPKAERPLPNLAPQILIMMVSLKSEGNYSSAERRSLSYCQVTSARDGRRKRGRWVEVTCRSGQHAEAVYEGSTRHQCEHSRQRHPCRCKGSCILLFHLIVLDRITGGFGPRFAE